MKKRVVLCWIAAAAFLLGGSISQAQLSTGSILGVVKDSSGAVVPGAKVTARDTGTGATRMVTTGSDGAYRFDALAVGNYSVTAEASGFRTEVQNGLALSVAQALAANFTLQVGQETQTVSVTTQAAQVDTTTSSLSSLVNPETMSNLPLNGRNYVDLSLLQPGVASTSIASSTTANAGTLYEGGAGQAFSSNGAPIQSNNYLLDGTIVTNGADYTGSSVIGTTLGVDGIQEYRIITNSFNAEYGQKMGSQMMIVSKGGTNQFHGDVFEYLRNSVLDSRNYFDLPPSILGRRLPPFRRNQFGGSLGGPIKKDKTFFYAVYEGLRSSLGSTNIDITADPACLGPAGATITAAACPSLGAASATVVPAAVPFEALYPAPNLPFDEYGFVYNEVAIEDYAQLRLDETFSAKDSAFARWTFDNATEGVPFNFNQSHDVARGEAQFITMAENHIFTPNLLNTARVSYAKNPAGENFVVTDPRLNTPAYQLAPGKPMGALVIGGTTTLGADSNSPRLFNQAITSFSDDLNYVHGRHSFKFGALYNHYNSHIYSGGYDKDNVIFSSIATFLQGDIAEMTGILPTSDFTRTFLYDTMGFYGQDSWRLTPRLTLNLGMRYEPLTDVIDNKGRSSSLRNPATDTSFTLGPEFANPSLRNWGPRVGFAWDVFGNGKTALRGGFGILYDQTGYGSGGLVLGAGVSPPYIEQYTLTNIPFTVPVGPPPALGTFNQVGPTFQWHINQPHLLSYNLATEQQLPGQMELTVAFAGSRGINLLNFLEANNVIPTGVPLANGGGACVPGPASAATALTTQEINGLTSQMDGSATSCYLPNSPRQNPVFGSIPYYVTNGDSIYNALETNLVKRISKGVQFQAAYTWSKLIDDLSNPVVVEPLSNASRRGPEAFDVTDVFHFNILYHLPDFAGSKGFVSKMTNGWWMSSILSMQSGDPFSVNTSGFPSQDGEDETYSIITDSPDVVPGRNNANMTHGVSVGCSGIPAGTPVHNANMWFDPCAFSTQPAGFIGTASKNLLRGPGYDDVDYSLVKDTAVNRLGEGGQVEFRAEFFNIANHTNLGIPNGLVASGSCPNGGVTGCTPNEAGPLPGAGAIFATNGTSRQIQFALKVLF